MKKLTTLGNDLSKVTLRMFPGRESLGVQSGDGEAP